MTKRAGPDSLVDLEEVRYLSKANTPARCCHLGSAFREKSAITTADLVAAEVLLEIVAFLTPVVLFDLLLVSTRSAT